MSHPDVCIAGAGIIGLSLALDLHSRGARVTVFDQGEPLAEASTAAAGMLAADDPENPPELQELSHLSIALYPNYLDRLLELGGLLVPFHTGTTLQGLGSHHRKESRGQTVLANATLAQMVPELRPAGQRFILLSENSLDPRELAVALLAAVRSTPIDLQTHSPVRVARSGSTGVEIHAGAQKAVFAGNFVDCTGAWAFTPTIPFHLRVSPRKGQMLAVTQPPSLPQVVIRTPDIYIVPRTVAPEQSRLVIGATVENAGFDKKVHSEDIARLRSLASELLPSLAEAEEVETWAGLRPATSDSLPLLGAVSKNHFVATGHYRNGILLAPATARVMSQLLAGEQASADLSAFSPFR
jgi:glycine oxidase